MENLTPAETYTLSLIAAINAGRPAPAVPSAQWPEVLKELKAQAVTAYPSDAIDQLGLAPQESLGYLHSSGVRNWPAAQRHPGCSPWPPPTRQDASCAGASPATPAPPPS